MREKMLRMFFYMIRSFAILFVIVGLCFAAFFSSMKTSNVYFLLNDALKARLDIILLKSSVDSKAQFFSYEYLVNEEYKALKEQYSLYNITGYSHKIEYARLFVWPWQTKKTVIVNEAVYVINGELDTSKMSKEDAVKRGLYNIPSWQPSKYKVTLILEDGIWMIDSVRRVGNYDYQVPTTPSLTEAEKEALRTPTPPPTPTQAPGEEIQGDRIATISNPIVGDSVNLREGPATAYDVIEKLNTGDKVLVKEESDGWYLVQTQNGKTGYVSQYYISFS